MKSLLTLLLHRMMKSCRQVTLLILAEQDRPLTVQEKLSKGLHLMVCKGCTRFDHQMGTMRQSMHAWRNYQESDISE